MNKRIYNKNYWIAAALSNKAFDDVGTAEVLVTAANAKLAALRTQLIENNENLNRIRKKNRRNEWLKWTLIYKLYLVFLKIFYNTFLCILKINK